MMLPELNTNSGSGKLLMVAGVVLSNLLVYLSQCNNHPPNTMTNAQPMYVQPAPVVQQPQPIIYQQPPMQQSPPRPYYQHPPQMPYGYYPQQPIQYPPPQQQYPYYDQNSKWCQYGY